ncbi:hypothetical protein AtubIFM57258_004418 [Aspergillus tubingensis]|nr:hypothetical protein AtubIFM57258_004418 [Aspergillus tubingensis]
MAQDLLTKKLNDDPTRKNNPNRKDETTRKLIGVLLENPPKIKDPPPTDDTYHVPQLPEWISEPLESFGSQSTIVDFYCPKSSVEFQLKRRPMKELIYEGNKGPNGIMKDVQNDFNELAKFKERLDSELKKIDRNSSSKDPT